MLKNAPLGIILLCSVLLSSNSSAEVVVVDSQADAEVEATTPEVTQPYPPGDELPVSVNALLRPMPGNSGSLVNQIPLQLPDAPAIDISGLSALDAMLYRIDILEQELRSLRGTVEEQQHTIMQLRQQQQARYLDLDRRLGAVVSELSQTPVSISPESTPLSSTTRISTVKPLEAEVAMVASPAVIEASQGVDAKAHYRAAFQKIRDKKYDIAIVQLNEHVKLFPQGAYTANAYYWLGEVYVVLPTPQLEQAQQAFTQVINRYPGHRKVPDALFKLGRVFSRLGDRVQAKDIWQALLDKYPQSSAAKLATTELESL